MFMVAWHPCFAHPLPAGHRFPMEKYDLLPQQLLHEGTIEEGQLFEPTLLSEKEILAVHSEEYWQKLKNLHLTRREERRTGFPLSKELIHRESTIMKGTVDATHYALKDGIAFNTAGGTHHAFQDRGEGFCLLNDIAIAAIQAIKHRSVNSILVVDLDVHQGNGTASILKDEEKVFTFSIHGKGNFPMKKERSDLDIPLPDGTEDEQYLEILDNELPMVIEKTKPELILYQSGVDVLESDKLGRLSLSIEGCRERDQIVLEQANGKGIPVSCSMGGGYSENIKDIIDAHANTYRMARRIFG